MGAARGTKADPLFSVAPPPLVPNNVGPPPLISQGPDVISPRSDMPCDMEPPPLLSPNLAPTCLADSECLPDSVLSVGDEQAVMLRIRKVRLECHLDLARGRVSPRCLGALSARGGSRDAGFWMINVIFVTMLCHYVTMSL